MAGAGWEGDKLGGWDQHVHTTLCKIEKTKDLLDSTGNSLSYAVITYNEKNLRLHI